MPELRIMFELGQWATPMPAAPNRSISAVFGFTQCRDPRAISAPTGALEVLDGAATEVGERVVVVLRVLGQVRVQTHVESLGQLGGLLQQLSRHGER